MSLTDTAIRKIIPSHKSFKLADSSGLYLLIKPNGYKLWYIKYRIDEKENRNNSYLSNIDNVLRILDVGTRNPV